MWPQYLEEFWANLLSVAWAHGVPGVIRNQLLSFFEQLHPSGIEHAVRVIQSLRQEPPPVLKGRKKKNKASGQEEDDMRQVAWIFHEEVLELLSRFVTRLMSRDKKECDNSREGDVGDFSMVPSDPTLPRALIGALQFCVSRWVNDFEMYANRDRSLAARR